MFPFKSAITWIDRRGTTRHEPAAFQERCLQFASYIHRLPQDRICILWEPSVDAFAAFVGTMLAQKVPAFFSIPTFKLDPAYFAKQLKSLQDQKFLTIGSPAHADLGLDHIVNLGEERPVAMPTHYSGDFVQFSSGTTGLRKQIAYQGKALRLHNEAYALALSAKKDERVISWLPHYHDMGLIACMLMPLQLGYDIIAMSNLSWVSKPQMLVDAILKHDATLCWQPNFAFQMMAERCASADLSKTRFISCAEPVFDRVSQRFEEHFSTTVRGCYAMAENVFAVTQAASARTMKGFRTSGKVFESNQVRIIDDEIAIRSDYLFSGYQSGETMRSKDGWYLTGDHGALVEDELFVFGRVDDSFKVRGEKIIPELIEAEANMIPGVKPGRIACVAGENSDHEEVAVLIYEGSLSESDLYKQVRHLGIERCVQVPANWLVKSSSGKVARKQCRLKLASNLQPEQK